ncbi:hypothetical protein [Teredinibacter turnerae]|nr:hypothetical protein [Teredinibacter turnerae]
MCAEIYRGADGKAYFSSMLQLKQDGKCRTLSGGNEYGGTA